MREGVVGASLDVDGTSYFDIHHTHADTLDKIDPKNLALCVATMADRLHSCGYAGTT